MKARVVVINLNMMCGKAKDHPPRKSVTNVMKLNLKIFLLVVINTLVSILHTVCKGNKWKEKTDHWQVWSCFQTVSKRITNLLRLHPWWRHSISHNEPTDNDQLHWSLKWKRWLNDTPLLTSYLKCSVDNRHRLCKKMWMLFSRFIFWQSEAQEKEEANRRYERVQEDKKKCF